MKKLLIKKTEKPISSPLQDKINDSKQAILETTENAIADTLFLPPKEEIGRCFLDAELITPSQAQRIARKEHIRFGHRAYKGKKFLIYCPKFKNHCLNAEKFFMAKKNDYIISPNGEGFVRFDGEKFVSYDARGKELGSF